MQIVEHDPAVGDPRAARDRQHVIERRRPRDLRRQHLKEDVVPALGGLPAQRRKRLGELRHIGAVIAQVADLDVSRAQDLGRIEQKRAGLVGHRPSFAGAKPIEQPFDLDVDDAVVVQDPLHVRKAVALADLDDVRCQKPMPANPARAAISTRLRKSCRQR